MCPPAGSSPLLDMLCGSGGTAKKGAGRKQREGHDHHEHLLKDRRAEPQRAHSERLDPEIHTTTALILGRKVLLPTGTSTGAGTTGTGTDRYRWQRRPPPSTMGGGPSKNGSRDYCTARPKRDTKDDEARSRSSLDQRQGRASTRTAGRDTAPRVLIESRALHDCLVAARHAPMGSACAYRDRRCVGSA